VFMRYTIRACRNGRGLGNRTPISKFVASCPNPLNEPPSGRRWQIRTAVRCLEGNVLSDWMKRPNWSRVWNSNPRSLA
jgi:hypothetical protein